MDQPRTLVTLGKSKSSCAEYEQKSGGGAITDMDECIHAASLLGETTVLELSETGPKRCFLYENSKVQNTLYFNTGDEETFADKFTPLCRLAADFKTYCPPWCITYNEKGNTRNSCEFPKCYACPKCQGSVVGTNNIGDRL